MRFFADCFRVISLICSYPFGLFMFKRRTFYEEGADRFTWKKGGALIVSNHTHFFDSVMMMYAVFPRKLNIVAGELMYKKWLYRFAATVFGCIKADRVTQDMSFMDRCAELLRRGQLVHIFPEGRYHREGGIGPFKKSYIVIAHRAGVPIIPVVHDSTYGVFKRTSIIVGKPIYPSDYIHGDDPFPSHEERDALNEMVHAKVEELRLELERRKVKDTRDAVLTATKN